jgi:hypothetical protein
MSLERKVRPAMVRGDVARLIKEGGNFTEKRRDT